MDVEAGTAGFSAKQPVHSICSPAISSQQQPDAQAAANIEPHVGAMIANATSTTATRIGKACIPVLSINDYTYSFNRLDSVSPTKVAGNMGIS